MPPEYPDTGHENSDTPSVPSGYVPSPAVVYTKKVHNYGLGSPEERECYKRYEKTKGFKRKAKVIKMLNENKEAVASMEIPEL